MEAVVDASLYTAVFAFQPEGCLAMDRFKSLQKRNIIESREVVRYVRITNMCAMRNPFLIMVYC